MKIKHRETRDVIHEKNLISRFHSFYSFCINFDLILRIFNPVRTASSRAGDKIINKNGGSYQNAEDE